MKKRVRIIAICLAIILGITGCGNSGSNNISDSDAKTSQEYTTDTNNSEEPTENSVDETKELKEELILSETTTEEDPLYDLTEKQKNSIDMLNYLRVISTEICSSQCSRIYLEKIYSEILDNIYPNAVDDRTLEEFQNLLDILKELQMIGTQKERTEYLYEQNSAQALRAAIPNPLGLLSAVQSSAAAQAVEDSENTYITIAVIVASVAYMAIDSYSSYTAYKKSTDLEELKETWKLNDEETKLLHSNRSSMFEYMNNIVHEYSLPGDLTLSEKDVEKFVEWKNETNIESKIQFFEDKETKNKYQSFGAYWLELAKTYYKHGDYEKCISAINTFEKRTTRIFRKDYEYADTLPIAIAAANNVMTGADYVNTVNHYVEKLIANCDQDNWQLRYIAAQTYVDLYGKTNELPYLENAYTLVSNNVIHLVKKQLKQNEYFLSDPILEEIPKDAKKDTRAEINERNEKILQAKDKEVPPVCEPLYLNCQLLFSLADKLNKPESEKKRIDAILHKDGEQLFLTKTIDDMFWFNSKPKDTGKAISKASMTKDTLTIPAKYVSENSKIVVTIKNSDTTKVYKKWKVSKVNRNNKKDFDSFTVTFKNSKEAKKFKFATGTEISIDVYPDKDSDINIKNYRFKVKARQGVPDFWNTYYTFEKVKK